MTETSVRKHHLAGQRTAVYRFFDMNDDLLYIGITHDLEERWGNHSRIQPWWLDVARREVAWYDTRAEAEVIEKIATASESPRYDRAGQRTTDGEVDQRLERETAKAVAAIRADLDNGTYPLWSFLPSYPELSQKYGIPMIGIARGLGMLAREDQPLVHRYDQFAVSRPGCKPTQDAWKVGLLFFLASNAFGDEPFTLADLVDTTGTAPGTAQQHVRRWQLSGRAERAGKVPGGRSLLFRITRHPEPDPPKVLTYWQRDDVRALAQWLNQQLDSDAEALGDDPAARQLVERDRSIVAACLPNEYQYGSVPDTAVRVLQVLAHRYRHRPGCLHEWGITEAAAE